MILAERLLYDLLIASGKNDINLNNMKMWKYDHDRVVYGDPFFHPLSLNMWTSSMMNFPSLYFCDVSKACSYFHPRVVLQLKRWNKQKYQTSKSIAVNLQKIYIFKTFYNQTFGSRYRQHGEVRWAKLFPRRGQWICWPLDQIDRHDLVILESSSKLNSHGLPTVHGSEHN